MISFSPLDSQPEKEIDPTMEKKDLYSKIASEQNISLKKVEAVVALLEEDATIPFIARYRKEATGSLDEVQIASIRDRLEQLK